MGFVMGDQMSEEAYRAGGYRDFLKTLDAPGFAERIDEILNLYDAEINQVQMNLLDSHDTPRYLTIANNDKTALTLGWFYMLTYPGAPTIYYGDEIGLDGHHDPDCRKSFPWQNKKSWDNNLRKYLKELIKLRKKHEALRRGSYQNLYAENNVVAYARVHGKKKYIMALNVSEEPRTISFPAEKLGLDDGNLKTIFGKTRAGVQHGQVTLTVPERSGVAFKA
jgi:neopullulanase